MGVAKRSIENDKMKKKKYLRPSHALARIKLLTTTGRNVVTQKTAMMQIPVI